MGIVAVGIVLGGIGYTFVYYAVQLWSGEAVSLASASGFAKAPSNAKQSQTGTTNILHVAGSDAFNSFAAGLSPLLFFL